MRIGDVQGTGPGGRITQEDVLLAAAAADPRAQRPTEPMAHPPLTRVRRITAERMAASAQATARVTLFLDADFSEAARFRTPVAARVCAPGRAETALGRADRPSRGAGAARTPGRRGPVGRWSGAAAAARGARRRGRGARARGAGRARPAGRRHAARCASSPRTCWRWSTKPARGRLSPAEMQGGTFTITNLGAYRIDGFTPIVNPPETAILGVGRIADKAVVIDGKVEVRTMCTLSLSFDHRVVDGAPGRGVPGSPGGAAGAAVRATRNLGSHSRTGKLPPGLLSSLVLGRLGRAPVRDAGARARWASMPPPSRWMRTGRACSRPIRSRRPLRARAGWRCTWCATTWRRWAPSRSACWQRCCFPTAWLPRQSPSWPRRSTRRRASSTSRCSADTPKSRRRSARRWWS